MKPAYTKTIDLETYNLNPAYESMLALRDLIKAVINDAKPDGAEIVSFHADKTVDREGGYIDADTEEPMGAVKFIAKVEWKTNGQHETNVNR